MRISCTGSQSGENSSIHEGQIKFIQALSDPSDFSAETKPDARIQFVCESVADFEDVSLHAAMKDMLSLKRRVRVITMVSSFIQNLSRLVTTARVCSLIPPELIADGVHLYRDKHHHWAEATLSLDEWFAQTTNDGWLQYWSKNWPPLVSNLKIQVDNPMENRGKDSSGEQTGLESFE